ncbi:MAG: hypothetical protein QOE03_2934, partial [Micromonosporaceae bacterium]|nr:hypothetical protein [Micromonosporaceae bacterium]
MRGASGVPAGRARVGGATGSARVGAGRAPVPGQGGVTGRATVGRASVRVGSPVGGSPGDIIEGPGNGRRPPMGAPPTAAARARRKRARRRNWILGGFALVVMIAGTTVVGGTFFYDDVALPQNLPQRDQATTIYFADNKTQMGKIGDENRTIIPSEQIPQI